jgi:hypothetical protein
MSRDLAMGPSGASQNVNNHIRSGITSVKVGNAKRRVRELPTKWNMSPVFVCVNRAQVHAPPGGASSFSLAWGAEPADPVGRSGRRAVPAVAAPAPAFAPAYSAAPAPSPYAPEPAMGIPAPAYGAPAYAAPPSRALPPGGDLGGVGALAYGGGYGIATPAASAPLADPYPAPAARHGAASTSSNAFASGANQNSGEQRELCVERLEPIVTLSTLQFIWNLRTPIAVICTLSHRGRIAHIPYLCYARA